MEFIAQDKWEEDIWGIEKADLASKDRIPILYLYFAENVGESQYITGRTTDIIRTNGSQAMLETN